MNNNNNILEIRKSYGELKCFNRTFNEVIDIFDKRYDNKTLDNRIEDLHCLSLNALAQQKVINIKLLEIIEYLLSDSNTNGEDKTSSDDSK